MAPREDEHVPFLLPVKDDLPSYLIHTEVKKDCDPKKAKSKSKVDEGWAWVIVVAAFTCCLTLDGEMYSFGVLMDSLQAELGGGVAGVAAAGSLQVGFSAFGAPIAAKLVATKGNRWVCIWGSILATCGLVGASFTHGLTAFMLSYSVVGGTGLGFLYLPAIASVAEWFDTKRASAIGMCVCGSGAGAFALAPIATTLLDLFGWRWTLRALACLTLFCSVCGMAMAPGPGKEDKTDDNVEVVVKHKTIKDHILGVSLSRNPNINTMLLMMVGDAFATCALYIPFTHLPPLAIAAGVPAPKASFLIASTGMGSVVGRLLAGWMSDQPWGSPHVITCVVVLLATPLHFILTLVSSYWCYVVLTIAFGFLTGQWISATTPFLVSLIGVEMLTPAFGLITFLRGCAGLAGPPLAGIVIQMMGDKRTALYMSGGLSAVSAIMYGLAYLTRKRVAKRDGYQEII